MKFFSKTKATELKAISILTYCQRKNLKVSKFIRASCRSQIHFLRYLNLLFFQDQKAESFFRVLTVIVI